MFYFLRFLFVLLASIDGGLLITLLASQIMPRQMGFDGIGQLLGWLMAGLLISLVISLFLLRVLKEPQLKRWVVILGLVLAGFFGWGYMKSQVAEQGEGKERMIVPDKSNPDK